MRTRILAILLAIFILPQALSAQAAILAMLFGDKVASENFNLSMEFGIPFNNFTNIDNSKSDRGINFGIAGNVKLSDNWFVSPSVYFLSKRNLELTEATPNTIDPNMNALFANTSADVSLAYTDVHLHLAYQPNNSNIRLGISPQVSFLGKANALYDGDLGSFDQDIKDFTNSTDYGVIGNIGYFFPAGHSGKGIHFNLRYYQGLTDVFKDELYSGSNESSYVAVHISLPFITEELAAKNLKPAE